ncbi:MAG: DNA polymerase III subunit gamma/tau [Candidatus Sericytochromatia bacterium]
MGHTALYRKWRPQTFSDLVGQEHISRTLINAINTNKVSHAYLFCGSRGTGKTTSARILAKSLNCESRVDGSPCNKCNSCIGQTQGSDLDVIEIDAASNRGISEIKTLIEQVRFASVSGKYKVYIIDEFHMLTTEAFNAILKTLEEPPEKVVFVLATTEAHKILPTIISRCQRFDFQRIPTPSLVTRLKFISEQENIKISDESILAIARKANGGLRDALSLLDQISSFSIGDGEVSTELVNQVLGMVSSEFLIKLAESIAYKDSIELLKTLNELLKAGNDPVVIITETISFFRNLLVVKSAPDMVQYLEVPMSNIDNFKKVSMLFSKEDILETLGFLNEAIEKIKKTQMAQLWLEVNMIQLCKKPKTPDTTVNTIPSIVNPIQVSQASDNVNNETVNKLLEKISFLESKVDDLSKRSFAQVERVHSPQHSYHENKSESVKNSDIVKRVPQPQNFDSADIWHKILKETKIKSVASAAVLIKGKLTNIDNEKKIVTVSFENEAFIDILKSGKYEKVEQALLHIFGIPYKLVMEKADENSIEDKKNSNTNHTHSINHDINSSSNTEHLPQETNVATIEKEPEKLEENEVKEDNKIIQFKTDKPKEEYQTESQDLKEIEQSDSIRDNIQEEYNINTNEMNNFEVEIRKQTDERYFKDVSEAFKGKIIKKQIL